MSTGSVSFMRARGATSRSLCSHVVGGSCSGSCRRTLLRRVVHGFCRVKRTGLLPIATRQDDPPVWRAFIASVHMPASRLAHSSFPVESHVSRPLQWWRQRPARQPCAVFCFGGHRSYFRPVLCMSCGCGPTPAPFPLRHVCALRVGGSARGGR